MCEQLLCTLSVNIYVHRESVVCVFKYICIDGGIPCVSVSCVCTQTSLIIRYNVLNYIFIYVCIYSEIDIVCVNSALSG